MGGGVEVRYLTLCKAQSEACLPRPSEYYYISNLNSFHFALGLHVHHSCHHSCLSFMSLFRCLQVTMSNWEASSLNPNQLVYAALDALVTGAVFRALRLWHSMPSDCSGCRVPLGVLVQSSGRRKLKRSNSNTACKAKVKADRASVCCTKEGSDKCWSCGRQTTE